ncbi:MAG TPA: hypothetical protein VGM37_03200 [Armatimonadota bacterium]|jgi:uncharacterized damage-inducible protein DinB
MTGNQQTSIAATRDSVAALFRTARCMPEDKLTWKPADTARSAFEILQECAQSAKWFIPMLSGGKSPEWNFEAVMAERAQWTTLDEVEKVCLANCESLYEAIAAVTPEGQEEEVDIPFKEGWKEKKRNIMWFQYWNTVYHTGQVNYIQTLYGDREMH